MLNRKTQRAYPCLTNDDKDERFIECPDYSGQCHKGYCDRYGVEEEPGRIKGLLKMVFGK